MSEPKDAMGSGLLLFLLGAAVGAVVVALVTPKSGPELRSDLKELGGKVRDKVRRVRCGLQEEEGSEEVSS